MNWLVTQNKRSAVALSEIPVLSYARFYEEVSERMQGEDCHCASYFGVAGDHEIRFFFLLLDDAAGDVRITSWKYDYYSEDELPSLTAVHHALHPFEREITENFGIAFNGNPYDKPLRFAHDRADCAKTINTYPYYRIDAPSLHEVNVGPIHAGIIEPGVFRFICNGEKVLHLEVVLGFQHRGLERMIRETPNVLRQSVLAETIAGDSAVSHAVAYCNVLEGFQNATNLRLDSERAVALELERMATQIGDMGALSMDAGYQLGQVACEALRTVTINTTQLWCGNRFGKGLVRPFGSNFPLTQKLIETISDNVKDIRRRFNEVCQDIFTSPSVLGRFEDCGVVSRAQAAHIGAVGMAARASNLQRDIRRSHPYGVYGELIAHEPILGASGDVMARATVRYKEVLQSAEYILKLLRNIAEEDLPCPMYHAEMPADSLSFALVEGWRGEICHVGVTDKWGGFACYKIKDPSVHNWYALSLAVRGAGISDFPIYNKSFNLSYCGHDL